jgi:peptidoglycan/xylan/chitin deacetylase (PgdA/CDA1 family)
VDKLSNAVCEQLTGMRSFLPSLLVLLSAVSLVAQQAQTKVTVARWPQERTAAISLTFDDALATHLDIVGPILRKHRLNGTFFVSTGLGVWEKRKQDWKQLAKDGNELGNHTVHHPCLLPEIEPHSQDYSPQMMQAEIRDSAKAVSEVVPRQRGLTFAYPCGNLSFGLPADQAKNSALYLKFVAEYAFGARIVGPGGAQDPEDISVLTVTDLGSTEKKDFSGLLAMADPAVQQHQWGVYCFHGVGADYLSVSTSAFDELASYLDAHREIWTAPFGDVLRYIQERKSAVIEIHGNGDGSVDVTLSWPLDSHIYDLPLTLKVEVTGSVKEITATADGDHLQVKMIKQNDTVVALVDVAPDTKVVHIARAAR